MSNPGRLIVVEGIDGSGKSTVAARLADHLCETGRTAVVLRPLAAGQPGLARLKSAARLSGTATAGMQPHLDIYAVHLTYSFVGMVADEVIPALAEGRTVVCDRYLASHLANQAVFGIDLSAVAPLLDALPTPDRTLHIRVDPDTAMSRIASRGESQGVFDQLPLLHRAAREFDHVLARTSQVSQIDGTAPVEDVVAASIASLAGVL
ncbi:dTMP kinase [Streptomyces sp. MUM 178J]|uniref:dTMP kinase n=1 Tax=Streptomyces sp. MUM 178J TaxID=2791991 RepID=UPI001F038B49|nr:dTMP kinase [Streptomyces sp. MUM 178J]WRQ80746.1 dTMP kinase [Streptomyces sp. MUM 178J]